MAQLPHLVSKLNTLRLRVLVPVSSLQPGTEAQAQRALERYCKHMIGETRQKQAAERWVGLRTFLIGWFFFGLSLAAAAAVTNILWLPAGIRELASESLIVAGWVVIWQPLDTLVQGWWPQWEEERTFRAIGELPLRVEGY
jgi:protein-S-isoprenylcysteine O-methyltransferase Ste14